MKFYTGLPNAKTGLCAICPSPKGAARCAVRCLDPVERLGPLASGGESEAPATASPRPGEAIAADADAGLPGNIDMREFEVAIG